VLETLREVYKTDARAPHDPDDRSDTPGGGHGWNRWHVDAEQFTSES